MKKIFSILSIVLCMASFTGCYDDLESKADIDAKYAGTGSASATLAEATASSFSTIAASGTVELSADTLLEVGVMVATSKDFSSYNSYKAEEAKSSFQVNVSGLEDNTTYYVRSYAVTGKYGTVVSEAKSVTTPVAPVFDLVGTYTAKQYAVDTESGKASLDKTYKVTVAFVEGDTTQVEITNLYEGGKTITGTYDAEKGTIAVARNQVIGVHASYGDVFIRPVNDAISGYVANATFTFQSKGGFLNSSKWAASVSQGNFGFYYVEMNHD